MTEQGGRGVLYRRKFCGATCSTSSHRTSVSYVRPACYRRLVLRWWGDGGHERGVGGAGVGARRDHLQHDHVVGSAEDVGGVAELEWVGIELDWAAAHDDALGRR